MPARDQDRSSRGEAAWTGLDSNRPGIGNSDGVVFVQFALPAIVEQAECRVAALLNFGKHDTGADGVDRAGRDVDDVAFHDRTPLHQFGDRAVPDRARNSCGVRCRFNPSATSRARLAARMYQASVLPFGMPIARANASSG